MDRPAEKIRPRTDISILQLVADADGIETSRVLSRHSWVWPCRHDALQAYGATILENMRE
jgi:hypothetical protein